MERDDAVSARETVPLVFQLRELVQPGSESERGAYFLRTQSSCGGEDVIEPE